MKRATPHPASRADVEEFCHRLLRLALLGSLIFCAFLVPHLARAQVTFDVIGPHEYDLPVNYQPWNVFVQYATAENEDQAWGAHGRRQTLDPGSHATVGMSKWVHFFTLQGLSDVGMGFEVIQPEVNSRSNARGDVNASSSSGFGDSIIGYAIWYKPTEGSTLGFQAFLQMPVGARDVSDTNWKNISSVLWYMPLGARFGWTGDAGWVVQSTRDDGVHPGFVFNTNNRFGWKLNETLEPFLALDYEHVDTSSQRDALDLPAGHTFDAGGGLMVNFFAKQSIALRYSHSLDGANHALTNEFALKYAIVF